MDKVKFKIKSPDNFVKVLSRFYSIDKDILLEVTPTTLISKLSSPDKSILKFSRIPLGDVLEAANFNTELRIPLYDSAKIGKVLKHFAPGEEIFLEVTVKDYDGYNAASGLTFSSEKLRIKVPTGDIELFKFIPADTLKKVVKSASEEKVVEFPFTKDLFEKASSLCDIDSDNDHLGIELKDSGELYLTGKSFEYKLDTIQNGHTVKFKMLNKFFASIDLESSNFSLGHNRLVIKSTESETIVVIGNVNE